MGREILYCSACQKQLRGADFEHGSAYKDAVYAYCEDCLPADQRPAKPPPPAETPRRGTAKIPIVGGRPKTARRSTVPGLGNGALLGGAIAAGAFFLLLLMAASGSRRRSEENVHRHKTPSPPALPAARGTLPERKEIPESVITPPRGKARDAKPEDVLRELRDMLAAGRSPAEILMKIEQEEAAVRGGPLEREFGDVRAQAEALRKKSDPAKELDALLAQVRALLDEGQGPQRKNDIEAMLAVARALGGPRQEDVRKLAERAREAFRAAAPEAVPLEVISLALVDLRTGKPLPGHEVLKDGVVIDVNRFDARWTGIRAQVRGPDGKSVRFDLDGKPGYRLEGTEPYDLDGTGTEGPMSWMRVAGRHSLTVVPFPQPNAAGAAGKSLALSFSVIPVR